MKIEIDSHVTIYEDGSIVYNETLEHLLKIVGVGTFKNGETILRKQVKNKAQWDSLKGYETLEAIDKANMLELDKKGK